MEGVEALVGSSSDPAATDVGAGYHPPAETEPAEGPLRPLRRPPLIVAGLTGGIASGKTTLARMFAERGCAVLDADRMGHEVIAPGEPALAEIVAAFGPEFLLPDGRLDRAALGARVFASRKDRESLNRMTHPRITKKLLKNIELLANRRPSKPVIIVEAALLIDAGWSRYVDEIIVVTAQHSEQVRRLMARSGLSRREAELRVRAQIPLHERLRHATYRVSGEAPPQETSAAIDAILASLLQSRRDRLQNSQNETFASLVEPASEK